MVYFDVPDADGTWAGMAAFVRRLPQARWRAPFDQPYGQRECHVIDPGGTLLLFGHALP